MTHTDALRILVRPRRGKTREEETREKEKNGINGSRLEKSSVAKGATFTSVCKTAQHAYQLSAQFIKFIKDAFEIIFRTEDVSDLLPIFLENPQYYMRTKT